ncbi:hypothetical protein [Embleya sp. AB8]|uniref:hypothetical protein n=1 Tax=Embleya sp. AB8 TaxID=3156304 RepID=UPI003C7149A7
MPEQPVEGCVGIGGAGGGAELGDLVRDVARHESGRQGIDPGAPDRGCARQKVLTAPARREFREGTYLEFRGTRESLRSGVRCRPLREIRAGFEELWLAA